MTFEVHVLASGSDGNCYVVVNDDRAVMVDCGLSCRKITELMNLNSIDPKSIEGILITHEHTDHTKGVYVTSKRHGIPVFCNKVTYKNSSDLHDVGKYNEIKTMKQFQLAGMDIVPLPTSHDAGDPCCFYFTAGDKRLLIVTDTGKLLFPVEHALTECDAAIIESNYDPEMLRNNPLYPDALKARIASDQGHMSNQYCGTMIKKTQTDRKRRFFLGHLSKKNNTPDLARETVAQVSGIKRMQLDCLEFVGDTRIFKV